MATINELKWKTLTATVHLLKSPNQFLKKLLFSVEDLLDTEDVELAVVKDGVREMAPFIEKNGEARMVTGTDHFWRSVRGPTIRIKRPFTPSELLFGRKPGTVIFNVGTKQKISEVQKHIARDLRRMNNLIANTEEFLAAMAVRGQISYSVPNGATFLITFPRDANHNVTLAVFWDDATPSNVKPEQDFLTAKRLFNDADAGSPTDAIMGIEASNAYRDLLRQVGNNSAAHFANLLEARSIDTGTASFVENFKDDGALFIGRLDNIRMWEYARQVLHPDGSTVDLIRPKYVEFVTTNNSIARRVMYYAAISDVKVLQGGKMRAKRFSKSWVVEDPSAMMVLIESRPFPWQGHPDASVSMKVVSG